MEQLQFFPWQNLGFQANLKRRNIRMIRIIFLWRLASCLVEVEEVGIPIRKDIANPNNAPNEGRFQSELPQTAWK